MRLLTMYAILMGMMSVGMRLKQSVVEMMEQVMIGVILEVQVRVQVVIVWTAITHWRLQTMMRRHVNVTSTMLLVTIIVILMGKLVGTFLLESVVGMMEQVMIGVMGATLVV
jgi:uncharacterized membrane protein YwzB